MQTFISDFKNILNDYRDDICQRISETYNIPIRDLYKICDDEQPRNPKVTKTPSVCNGNGGVKKKGGKCTYIFMKGTKKNLECGVRVVEGNMFCAKHSNKDRKPKEVDYDSDSLQVKKQSILDCMNELITKTGEVDDSELCSNGYDSDSDCFNSDNEASESGGDFEGDETESEGEESQIRKNKYGNYMDEETLFVFNHDGLIYGKQDMETGEVYELDDEDKILVEECGWEHT